MSVEREIADLRTRLSAVETVHAVLIGMLSNFVFSGLGGHSVDAVLKGVREAIKTGTIGTGDPALAERVRLLSEQYLDDAIHLIEHGTKIGDQGSKT